MPTESCYRCGKQLEGYFRLLCDECRAKAEIEEATGEDPDDETPDRGGDHNAGRR